ncbi:MAG: hypothetical protein QF903_04365 [Planctomycetota bacterium]|nr:hypothetical protein [Planctomycetota bacterium]MDP6764349.1 hypothetical protein [Planctomycetota bacterium]MDP6988691.1 hypothetical protein [Planctomycetota bacterium]
MKLVSTLLALGLLTGLAHRAGLPLDPFGGGRMANGERVSTYEGGAERERASWEDGVREGPCRRWYPDGTLKAEGRYEAGRKSGPWRFYAADGTLDAERSGTYEADRRLGPLTGA